MLNFASKLAVFILAFAVLATAATAAEMSAKYTINESTSAKLGTYLVNQTGFTFYYFMNDKPGKGMSACTGQCIKLWPPFYAENITVPATLNKTDFTDVNRTDKMEQLAFKGWPLYYYSGDKKPGDTNGQGIGNLWYVVNPASFPPKT